MKNRIFVGVFLPLFVGLGAATAGIVRPFVVYGDDNRRDVFEETDAALRIATESIAALIPKNALSNTRGGRLEISGESYGNANRLCPTEKYFTQTAPAECSGFLVAKNIIATAGHCVQEANFCKDIKIVFGFMLDSKVRNPNIVSASDVYGCKSVLHEQLDYNGVDFALVELDRPVINRGPLEFSQKPPSIDDALIVLGHPAGLPLKIADGASVRSIQNGFFVANTDSFSGSSGSPILNDNYEVAGILVRGERDFLQSGSCFVTNHCASSECNGEDATNAEVVAMALKTVKSL